MFVDVLGSDVSSVVIPLGLRPLGRGRRSCHTKQRRHVPFRLLRRLTPLRGKLLITPFDHGGPQRRDRMAVDFVPPDHLSHLLRLTTAPGKLLAAMLKKAALSDRGVRNELLKHIEKEQPGTLERLENLWFFSGQRTIHLWRVPVLDAHTTASGLFKRRGYDQAVRAPGWHTVTNSGKRGQNRVFEIAAGETKDVALARVLLHAERGRHDEDLKKQSEIHAYPVEIKIHLGYETPLLEVHTSIMPARQAMFALLDWVLEAEVPRNKSREQELMLQQLTFNEASIRPLAAKLGWEEVLTEGYDKTGGVGELTIRGKKKGWYREPLNMNDPLVRQQHDSPKDARAYNIAFQHKDDGFQEKAEIEFRFTGYAPHSTFKRAATSTAVGHVIERLYEDVWGGDRR